MADPKDSSEKESSKDTPVVRQVIEIVDEDTQETKAAETPPVRQEVEISDSAPEQHTEKAEQNQQENIKVPPRVQKSVQRSTPPANKEYETKELNTEEDDSSHDRQQEVVKELFRKKDSLIDHEITEHKKKGPKAILLWLSVVLVVAFLVSGSLIMLFGGSLPEVQMPIAVLPTSTPEATRTPEPTTEPTDVPKEVTIQVLNGSGVSGVARTMRTRLEDLGYTVGDTGNASSFDYEQTQIQYTPDVKDTAVAISQALEDEYTVSLDADALDEDSDYDIVIIIGEE